MGDEQGLLTAEEFVECRFDLPETGQWSELEAGKLVHLQPPDLDHGNTILNLSKLLAEHAGSVEGYPCFDLGLLLQRDPDTVWFPAVSYFVEGRRFAETDCVVTETIPALVMELVSSADRRRRIDARVARYLELGVATVWVIDPALRSVRVVKRELPEPILLTSGDALEGTGALRGMRFEIRGLFAEPVWWS